MIYLQDTKNFRCSCGTDACSHGGEFYMHGRCHGTAPNNAVIEQGVLTVSCSECDRKITDIAVEEQETLTFSHGWVCVRRGEVHVETEEGLELWAAPIRSR